ncbi:hypothetical protein [Sphingomonas panacisoli]|uniref:hypothetical protein n=1 Tax=Sphingomonas panacisoli TaxID=1813879 RepID=UPI0016494D48|nr:hypothetical protein [Sphingomonas panacisoli]
MDDKSALSNDDTERKPGNDTPGGQPVEKVEDRPNVGTVKPEDYPHDQRAKGVT